MEESKEATAGMGYPLGQIAAALTTSQEHPDPAVRERAVGKSENWIKVFQGMLSGVLKIGSRTPVAKTPGWATLQVIKGGYATGGLLAQGPLLPHEEALLARLSADSTLSPSMVLNSYYLTDAGIAELQAMLKSGCYRINVPEEGALLVIAWLLQNDQAESAREILYEIGPFLNQLRFYPIGSPRPLPESALVQLQTVEEGIDNLKRMRVPERVQVQRESTQVWGPLYDRAVDLFLETLDRAAQAAGTLLMDSLYARYYDIPYARIRQAIDYDDFSAPYSAATSPAFFQLCSERAGPAKKRFSVAYNGTIIEQGQILTTHNLAVLFLALGLKETLQPRLTELAQHCFQWICTRHQQRIPGWQSRLRMVKNTAYAWRQMLFFLALESEETAQEFLPWANAYLQTQSPEFQTRFQPAMAGLTRALQGWPLEESPESFTYPSARRFLGWTTETHWLLAKTPSS